MFATKPSESNHRTSAVRRHVLPLLLAALVAWSAPAVSAGLDAEILQGIEFEKQPRPEWIIGGQYEPHEFVLGEKAGAQYVFNLRGIDEFDDWDAAKLADALEMGYYHIPIRDGSALSREAVEEFDAALDEIGDAPAMFYCGSGNRVGAMFALRAGWLHGEDLEAAVELGRNHGLTGLESRVRELLEAE